MRRCVHAGTVPSVSLTTGPINGYVAPMHRRELLRLLDAHVVVDDHERHALERLRRFVEAEPRCFERSLESGHVTGSAWIVCPSRRRVLLTHHRKLELWLQLGGHCDGDADVCAVALREAHEESGLDVLRLLHGGIFDVDVHEIPARPGEPAHFHYDVRFLLEADPKAPLIVSVESRALAWVELGRVPSLSTDASVMRMAAKT